MSQSDHSFVVYIDEAGDDGHRNFRPPGQDGGTSHWLTVACCIVAKQNDTQMPQWRDNIMAAFPKRRRRDLHFSNMRHEERVHICEQVSELPIRLIAVMSNKTTIPDHPRADLFAKKNTLYWYLCRYLIERVSRYCRRRAPKVNYGDGSAKIIFSRRGGMNYDHFRAYLRRLKTQQEAGELGIEIYWPAIDIEAVEALDHKNRAGLQIADVPASAFNFAVDPNRFGSVEPRYAKLLAPRVLVSETGWYIGHGVKPVPGLDKMSLTPAQREIFDFYHREGRRAGPRPLYHHQS